MQSSHIAYTHCWSEIIIITYILPILFFLQMKVTLALATFCLVAACADAQKGRTTTTTATKPGRFLSLPVPAKCASRKYLPHHIAATLTVYGRGFRCDKK